MFRRYAEAIAEKNAKFSLSRIRPKTGTFIPGRPDHLHVLPEKKTKNSVNKLENSPPYEYPVVIGHPALREVSTPVADGSDIPNNLIRTMNWIAMEDKRNKLHQVTALSAPQLGINKRIIGIGLYCISYT